ncbi:non-ribosomal peptide synthetase component F [Mumia flava]|uniref:Non-ribosomal peptide synthetase component F n=1 Tax=Mumia flava TaxID=1348852 RepID=A0A0B2AXR1_9ACTN|nr:condensation domain-containing protein [Mumia flava]PJJ54097.1 non-ribosomal peptide synthetase component F [Mumia flava]
MPPHLPSPPHPASPPRPPTDAPTVRRSAIEDGITAIFRDVLGRDDVDAHDDFFDLGGSSLMAVRALGRIHERYGVRVRAMDFFESPVVATLAAHVSQAAPAERPAVTRRPADAAPVLSYDQQRLWLEDQLLPSAAYHVHGRQRLVGELDVATLDASLRAIMQRHEALRSRFPVSDGATVQVVDELAPDWHLRFEDLSERPDRDDAARALMDDDASTPFPLEHGPLVRCLVIRTSPTEHLLSITAHHIVCDDWSVDVFVRELSALYAAGGDPQRADLPELEVQYRDFAVWQRRWLTGESLTQQVDYWREHLAGAPPALALPSRRRRRPGELPAGGRVRTTLSEADTRALDALCRQADATSFMVVLAGFATVLGRWSGQEDVVIGVPITGRSDARVQRLIGFFVNTLPVRVRLGGDPTFAELLARARSAALGGYAHAEAPLDLLVGEIPATRVPSRTPLFQVILNGVETPEVRPLAGTSGELLDTPTRPSKFELNLSTRAWGGALQFDLEFDASRYEQEMIEQLLDQTLALLRTAANDPDRRLSGYVLGSAGTGASATVPGDAGQRRMPPADPSGVAVVDGDGAWSRGRVDTAADRVARALRRHLPIDDHGGGTDRDEPRVVLAWRPVAVCAAAVLGCLLAGIAVTLDDGDGDGDDGPAAAGLEVCADASGIVLRVGDDVVEIDLGEATADAPGADVPTTPPGDWAAQRYGLDAHDRVGVLGGSTGSVICALRAASAAGATVVLLDPAHTDGQEASATPDVADLTVLFSTPPPLRALAEDSLPTLRHVVVENDGTFLSRDVAALRRSAPSAGCTGVYRIGPDGRPAAVHEVPREWSVETAPLRVPLGHAAHDGLRLVRRGEQDAAVGEVAELRVGERPGDEIGRRWVDGTVELVGAIDADPGAATLQTVGALRELPDVVDALVVELPDDEGGTELVAYVATAGADFDPAAAQPQLAARLVDALLPTQLVVLERLPLTPAGRYDLAALPRPEPSATADRYAPPRTPLEEQLVEILAGLLGVDRVGIHDSFFELGGFSLLATQLNIRIRETVHVDLALRDIFASATVEMLAQRIAVRQAQQARADDVEALLSVLESQAAHHP